jgi:hypothetical protein
MNGHDEKVFVEIGKGIIEAITKIAQGDVNGPAGLEGLGVAIAGINLGAPLGTSIEYIGRTINTGLSDIAQSIDNLADAIRESKGIES